MSGSLVDTNILSEFARRGEPDPAVKQWLTTVDERTLYVSVLALAEVRRGIEKLDEGKRRTELQTWFEGELIPSFENRILPVSQAIADRWAVLSMRLERRGKTQPLFDGLMAVTALEHGLTVVTRNEKDFVNFDVPILNPWEVSK